jgi:hypothetical protein
VRERCLKRTHITPKMTPTGIDRRSTHAAEQESQEFSFHRRQTVGKFDKRTVSKNRDFYK